MFLLLADPIIVLSVGLIFSRSRSKINSERQTDTVNKTQNLFELKLEKVGVMFWYIICSHLLVCLCNAKLENLLAKYTNLNSDLTFKFVYGS